MAALSRLDAYINFLRLDMYSRVSGALDAHINLLKSRRVIV
jgi:hypothetical protein